MGYNCKLNGVAECSGCGSCEDEPVMYDEFDDTPIYAGEKYYNFNGFVVAKSNLEKWAGGYKEVAD